MTQLASQPSLDGQLRPSHDGPSQLSLDGLRVAVTGGTSGLGLALVEALDGRGAHVAFVARREKLVTEVASRHPNTHGIVGDVSRKEDTHRIAMRIAAALDGLDVLINNASRLSYQTP